MNTISQPSAERRRHEQNGYVYLLNDEARTAWIVRAPHIGRTKRYRVPDHAMIDGERYTVECIEIGAFRGMTKLRHLTIPDSIAFIDEYNFSSLPCLRSIYVGKGLEFLTSWTFQCNKKLRSFVINKENQFVKIDKGVIYSKDGKTAYTSPWDLKHIRLNEGVVEIAATAFWCNQRLKSVSFPSTLKKIGDNSLSHCSQLKEIVLPEGFEECVTQCFELNENLQLVDFPSTMTDFGHETLDSCPRLEILILRCNQVMNVETFDNADLDFASHCTLYVPENLIDQYKQHPLWGKCMDFKSI